MSGVPKTTLRFEDLLGGLRELRKPLRSQSVLQFSSVQLFSCVWLFATPRTAACQASLFITNSRSLLKLMSFESLMPSNHLILYHPLLFLPSIFPSIRVFPNQSVLHIRWPKYWSFSFTISPSNEYSGLISFRMDWLDLLAIRGTLKSLPQHHSSKASILWHSAFFIVQLSHAYMTTGKTVALTRWTFVGKVMSLLSNMPSRLVMAFLPRSRRLFRWTLLDHHLVPLVSRWLNSERTQIKAVKGERCTDSPSTALQPCPLSGRAGVLLNSPRNNTWQHTKYCQPGKLT